MSGHTPGPWRMEPGFPPENANGLYGLDGQYFAELWFHGLDTDEANARLIAAAPELLEAAKEAEKLLLPLAERTEDHDRYQVMVLVLRIAIAKAEGRE